jgi:hypothetical protein
MGDVVAVTALLTYFLSFIIIHINVLSGVGVQDVQPPFQLVANFSQ